MIPGLNYPITKLLNYSMSLHIGIVACSAEGAALCYRTVCLEGAAVMGRHAHPEVSMHTHPLADYMRCIYAGDWQGVADLMLSSAEKLACIGADFLICPDNTIHRAFDLLAPRSPRPWLHIVEEVANEARRQNYRRLAVGNALHHEGPGLSRQAGSRGDCARGAHRGGARAH